MEWSPTRLLFPRQPLPLGIPPPVEYRGLADQRLSLQVIPRGRPRFFVVILVRHHDGVTAIRAAQDGRPAYPPAHGHRVESWAEFEGLVGDHGEGPLPQSPPVVILDELRQRAVQAAFGLRLPCSPGILPAPVHGRGDDAHLGQRHDVPDLLGPILDQVGRAGHQYRVGILAHCPQHLGQGRRDGGLSPTHLGVEDTDPVFQKQPGQRHSDVLLSLHQSGLGPPRQVTVQAEMVHRTPLGRLGVEVVQRPVTLQDHVGHSTGVCLDEVPQFLHVGDLAYAVG